jgi:hypothetical protein
MLRDQLALGLRLDPRLVERWGLDVPEFDVAGPDASLAPLRAIRPTILGLAPDVQVNDKSGDAPCAQCVSGAPLGQAETTVAAGEPFLLAGWNDTRGFCPPNGAVQGYGYSTDMGTTWTDAGDVPPLPTGGRYRGDPVHAVNRTTGDFYICGLYESGVPGSGLALLRGHFAGGSFVVDLNTQIAFGGSDFLDKEWMDVDAVSGNVYVSYTNFPAGANDRIEFIRSTTNGASWSAPIAINAPINDGLVQGSRPVVGPDGELYIVWYEYGAPLSAMKVRRSDDFGVSFGPEHTVCTFYENSYSGAPGYRRPFAPTLPGAAVDRSSGPHRGRLYVTWDEAVNFYDTGFSTATPISEVENNGSFAGATPFGVGDVLRGTMASTADLDLFRFAGTAGQTLFFGCDSATAATAIAMRLVCEADTSSVANYRFLAFNQGTYPAFAFTIPVTGTYYLRLNSAVSTVGDYRILTAWDIPSAGERARDHRDQFISWSPDGGNNWSVPAMLTDAPAGFDGIFPEVTADGLGRVHVYWHDWRDDASCGAVSYEYATSSGDGGVTWGPNRRLSDAPSFWSVNACGSANQGDYQGVTSQGQNFYPVWADSRLGDPDVFMERSVFSSVPACPGPVSGTALDDMVLTMRLTNTGNSETRFSWQVVDDHGWIASASPGTGGEYLVGPGAHFDVLVDVDISPTCSPSPSDVIRFITEDLRIPGRFDTCATTVTCTGDVTGVPTTPTALTFSAPRPNPASGSIVLGFTMPRAGPARLAVFDASGSRVRTLLDQECGAGARTLVWDGRDERGRELPGGIYYLRLEAGGSQVSRTAVIVR